MTSEQVYAVIATTAGTIDGQSVAAGQVVNRIIWDGAAKIILPTGTETRADPTGALPIGTITTV